MFFSLKAELYLDVATFNQPSFHSQQRCSLGAGGKLTPYPHWYSTVTWIIEL